jgi:DNA modification methylase
MKLNEIYINPKNPRIIKDDRFKKLCQSIKEFPKMMKLRPIIVDSNGMILGGNMRFKALKELGYKDIPDEWVKRDGELTEAEKQRFVIADNIGFGEYDWDVLANEWDKDELIEWGIEIPNFAFKQEAVEDDYNIPDEIETDIVLGDLFEIGNHRLLCGDSTKAQDVEKVLNGKEPYLMVTDPPYGVSYDAHWRLDAGITKLSQKRSEGKVTNDDRSDWTEAWSLSPSKVVYVWHGALHSSIVAENLQKCDFQIRSQIIWAKNAIVMGRGNYHWKHEPCWYAVKKGNKGNWCGDHKQSTIWDIMKCHATQGSSDDMKTNHSTQKPVECMARPIRNHDGDVYDPFIGSGTSMVASHQLNRKCYGIEISPKYCQVIIDRMRNLDPAIVIKKNGKLWPADQKQI